jgi:CheY-like chemotaxis protein/nitrogen-specific signal transduction histidine kinase
MLSKAGPGALLPITSKKTSAGRRAKVRAKVRAKSPRKRRVGKPNQAELVLAVFAHEIRTSLTGILALGELLVTSGLGEREARWAASVKSMAEHLAALINLTIDSVRAEAEGLVLRREPFRLRGLGETLAASLAARAEAKDLRSKAVIPRGLQDRVTGDAVRLRAAVENLIDNAVKFTDSGSVRLEMTAKPQSRGRIRVTFIVSDSGIGLKPAEIKRLFMPVALANDGIVRRYGGAGLGLVFVRRVARAMGGDLKVTSTAGKGSRFVLTAIVDKTTASAEQSVGPGAPPNGANGAALKILCAEDNPYGRVVINAILSELGHRADFVGSSEAAVQAVSGGHYDLVLMDVMLGETSGIEATRAIRALPGPPGRVPIIGISGHAAPGDEAKGRAAGMNGYVIKPVNPRMLAAMIADVAAT